MTSFLRIWNKFISITYNTHTYTEKDSIYRMAKCGLTGFWEAMSGQTRNLNGKGKKRRESD